MINNSAKLICPYQRVAFGRCSALRIISVYVRIAVKRYTQGPFCGRTRKQLEYFVTIKLHTVTASPSST